MNTHPKDQVASFKLYMRDFDLIEFLEAQAANNSIPLMSRLQAEARLKALTSSKATTTQEQV